MLDKSRKTELQEALISCRTSFFSVGLFSMAINILMLVPSFYMLQVYDRVLTSGSHGTLFFLTLLMMALLSVKGVLDWVRSLIMGRVANRLDSLISRRLFTLSFYRALYSGHAGAASLPLKDFNGVRQFLSSQSLFAFFDAPWTPVYILVMYLFHPLFGLAGLVSALVLFLLSVLNEKSTHKVLNEANQEFTKSSERMEKSLHNAEVVAAMGMMNNLESRWQEQKARGLFYQTVANDRTQTWSTVSKTLRLILQSLILGLGAWLVLAEEITPGLMIAGSILLGRVLAPIDVLISSWKQVVSVRSQYQRLNDTLQKIPEQAEKMPLPDPSGNISAEGIVVAAPGTKNPILKKMSFHIDAGDSVAIVGPSAAGKSTLVRSVLGIWPAIAGNMRLDGVDIGQCDPAALGPHIGYLPQDIELFEGTISENIARFGDINPDKVIAAAQLAGVHHLILKLPQGYDTTIGAGGFSLSGGQRQRIGLARALYGEPKLIVLDEPNSNLDEEGEQALVRAMAAVKKKGSTLLVITHRANLLSFVDKVMVLVDGTVKAYGPTEETLKQIQNVQSQQKQVSAQSTGSAPQAQEAKA